jgi:hypothetical protein
MNKILLIGFLLAAFILQTSFTTTINYDKIIVFEDHFDDNSKDWQLNTAYSQGLIHDGYFELASLGERSDIRMQSLEVVKDGYDFEIEAAIQILDDSDFCNAIVWGTSSTDGDFEKGQSFGINSRKEFIALDTREWVAHDLINWENSELIVPATYNKILLKKEGKNYHFFINEELVKSLPIQSFDGNNFGFHAANGATIRVDYFKVSIFVATA